MSASLLMFLLAMASPADQQAPPQAAPQTAKPGTVMLVCVSETGKTLVDAVVKMTGPVDRGGTTGTNGLVAFENVPAGTYRARITHEGSTTFEKEIIVRAGMKHNVEAMLTAAPPAPTPTPTPTPTPSPVSPWQSLKAGDPRAMPISDDLINAMLKEKQPNVERDFGCSGATSTRLILARENIALHRHVEVDEVLYVVAGEGTVTIDQKDHAVKPAWYILVPRGLSHSIARSGRTPLVLLSVQSGQPCK